MQDGTGTEHLCKENLSGQEEGGLEEGRRNRSAQNHDSQSECSCLQGEDAAGKAGAKITSGLQRVC